MTDEPKVLLIVEDDEGLQRQLKWAYDGYQVIVAGDRASAIEMLRAYEPAVVTLDLGLPPDPDGTDEGFATLAEILQLKPDTKVVVATGHGARESATRRFSPGCASNSRSWDKWRGRTTAAIFSRRKRNSTPPCSKAAATSSCSAS